MATVNVKVKEITVSKSALVSIGNYENVRIELSMTAAIDESDNVADVREQMTKDVNAYISDEVDGIELKQRKASSKAGRFGVNG